MSLPDPGGALRVPGTLLATPVLSCPVEAVEAFFSLTTALSAPVPPRERCGMGPEQRRSPSEDPETDDRDANENKSPNSPTLIQGVADFDTTGATLSREDSATLSIERERGEREERERDKMRRDETRRDETKESDKSMIPLDRVNLITRNTTKS